MHAFHENYIVDAKGKKTATILPYKEWQQILEMLEDYEDICAADRVKSRSSDSIPWEKVKAGLRKKKK